eukprot:CAMPEP_0183302024 /NCGR_PEP_ID=MMETSP0160_2-20130417/7959_1 /TAXON_ID=2839 ORGANISM="Odontella Sinensis, Strain Grunow 1884" /NCGR_SAMPLE_ID=MMETSP0160_2 /ASSEMBLY_ACC=CAM_ASM_000250 /LENGTH=123 /DNA_ID=CAMNT_0025464747 /DNA_START=462 /DNA_END=833 /DNA_ORIENTATION=-
MPTSVVPIGERGAGEGRIGTKVIEVCQCPDIVAPFLSFSNRKPPVDNMETKYLNSTKIARVLQTYQCQVVIFQAWVQLQLRENEKKRSMVVRVLKPDFLQALPMLEKVALEVNVCAASRAMQK